MLAIGQQLTLDVDKPAAGGRMIARHEGQVVLVAGAIPGERVVATVTKVTKGLAFADTVQVDSASPDRRPPCGDPACGGAAFAHIDYPRQLGIKAEIITDALARLGGVTLPVPIRVAGSRTDGYRMRARVHSQGGRLGFFREGTHLVCDPRPTRQLLPATCDALEALAAGLASLALSGLRDVDVSENVDGSQRAIHLESSAPVAAADLRAVTEGAEVSGVLLTAPPRTGLPPTTQLVSGDPYVNDRLDLGGTAVSFRRHVQAFFQGNRYLLPELVAYVMSQVPEGQPLIDLYAGVGLFAVSAAAVRGAPVVAVEGDPHAARDLEANAASFRQPSARIEVVHRSVERYLGGARTSAAAVILDPPRTGMSAEAMRSLTALAPGQIIYVSCDVATLARDVRRFVAAGYSVERAEGFDLFPNTAHVEAVMTLRRA